VDFSKTRVVFGEITLLRNHAGIFDLSFRFYLNIVFLCLGPNCSEYFFIFLLFLPLFFPLDDYGFFGAVDCTELTLEVWARSFVGVLVWIYELGLVDLFDGLCFLVILLDESIEIG
jgi:hypothetical protein